MERQRASTGVPASENFDYAANDRLSTERVHRAVQQDSKLAFVIDTCIYDQVRFNLEHASFQRLPELTERTRGLVVLSSAVWETETRMHFEAHLEAIVTTARLGFLSLSS